MSPTKTIFYEDITIKHEATNIMEGIVTSVGNSYVYYEKLPDYHHQLVKRLQSIWKE